ncbi:MAG: hypothetical protein HY878_04465 [Deltaproteobacteria bacterium]|nr:hypothetical protein [Deltaproteobacteria bacterium]
MWWKGRMREGVRGQGTGVRKQELGNRDQETGIRVLLATCYFLFSIFYFLSFIGCATNKAEVKPPQADYLNILNEWTRAQKVYDGLDTKLHIYATYKSWAFRMAYVDEYARRYLLDQVQKENLLAREREVDERFNEFFITAYTPDPKWNDFDRKGSIWTIYMEDDKGNRVSPIEVKKVDEKDPLVREFFPYLDLWSLGYVVRFPKYPPAGEGPFPGKDFRLIITGALGRAELRWRVE